MKRLLGAFFLSLFMTSIAMADCNVDFLSFKAIIPIQPDAQKVARLYTESIRDRCEFARVSENRWQCITYNSKIILRLHGDTYKLNVRTFNND